MAPSSTNILLLTAGNFTSLLTHTVLQRLCALVDKAKGGALFPADLKRRRQPIDIPLPQIDFFRWRKPLGDREG